jgi:PleD family two-component response regulator
LYRRIRALTGNAGIAGVPQIAQLTSAIEVLLKELHEKPKNINASTIRTVALAIDFLNTLLEKGASTRTQEVTSAQILVVDDEAISRRAIAHALDKANLKCVQVDDAQAAYDLLLQRPFELIFLDVDMPGMNGFELCSKLRSVPAHKNTPVVFVTGFTDFESRANSIISGGNDLIGKPFLFIELAVKALVFIWRHRLEGAKA